MEDLIAIEELETKRVPNVPVVTPQNSSAGFLD
jgi:hypothetical protein